MILVSVGFQAYLGMMYVEVSHTHPVMKCFVELLLQSVAMTTDGQSPSSTLERGNGGAPLLMDHPGVGPVGMLLII